MAVIVWVIVTVMGMFLAVGVGAVEGECTPVPGYGCANGGGRWVYAENECRDAMDTGHLDTIRCQPGPGGVWRLR